MTPSWKGATPSRSSTCSRTREAAERESSARERRPGGAWWRSAVLGTLNIGAFFAFLFIAAYRLPGGVAATIGAIQPLVVGLLAARVLGEALTRQRLVAGAAGIVGVALLVLQANGRLDAVGIAAAVGGVLSMAARHRADQEMGPTGASAGHARRGS